MDSEGSLANSSKQWPVKAMLLLQVDLEGHSLWFHRGQKPVLLAAKAELADALEELMAQRDFSLVFWDGDGGLYAREAKVVADFDDAVDAARAIARRFQDWRGADDWRSGLRLRVSIHLGFPVFTHPKPGYWTSVHLNAFVKHERDIAIAGTIAVTDTVRDNLSADVAKEFPLSTRRDVVIGGAPGQQAPISHVYYSAIEGEDVLVGQSWKSFAEFLKVLCEESGLNPSTTIGPPSAVRASIGDAVLLHIAAGQGASMVIDLTRSVTPEPSALEEDEAAQLEELSAEMLADQLKAGLEDGQKVSPERVVFPLLDVPCAGVEWHPDSWSRLRAFHRLLHGPSPMHQRLAAEAADVQAKGLPWPGLLCTHLVARIADEDYRPCILLCQRNIRGHPFGYHEGLWSCSIEEQIHPFETVEGSALRGISEELLGPQASEYTDVRILGLFLEQAILNLSVLAVAEIPLRFRDVAERWQRDAPDKNEHRQIIGLPLSRDNVLACARYGPNGGLPEELRDVCLVADKSLFNATSEWSFHPTALLRLVTVLWVWEAG